MKIKIESKKLLGVLKRVKGTVATKSTVPILETVKITADGILNIESYNSNQYSKSSCVCDIMETGSVCVDSKRLFESVSSLDCELTIISDTNYRITIITDRGNYKISGYHPGEFSTIPDEKYIPIGDFENSELNNIINTVGYAVSREELRPSMCGICINFEKGKICATDGHRLAVLTKEDLIGLTDTKEIILPSKLLEVMKLWKGECEISISKKQIKLKYSNGVVISNLIDEQYPNFEAVIPVDYTKYFVCKKNELLQSVKRVGIYSSKSTNQVKLDVKPGSLVVSSYDMDLGTEASEEIFCNSDFEFEVGFNHFYLLETLSKYSGEDVTFYYESPLRAVLISDSYNNSTHIIMPVRLNS